jgi:hypothetical protein
MGGSEGIVTALIAAVATLLAAVIGKISFDSISSVLFRRNNNIPNIIPTAWKATWYSETNEVYVVDQIELKKWTSTNKFTGTGDMSVDVDGHPKRYVYPVEGEITPGRMVVLTYRAHNFPTQSLIGCACMELGESANDLIGWWIGKKRVQDSSGEKKWVLISAKVKMTRLQ